MESAKKKPDCPYCGAPMRPVVMRCDACEVEVRGAFSAAQFARLPADDQLFLERYLLAGFSIKALAEQSGQGYVAIRNRLDHIIQVYEQLHSGEQAKRAILERLERGELTPQQAARELEKL